MPWLVLYFKTFSTQNSSCFYILITAFVLITLATASAVEGKMGKKLKKILKKLVTTDANEELAVADAKLGSVIKVSSFFITHCVLLRFCF